MPSDIVRNATASAASAPACATTPAPDLTPPNVVDMYPGPGAIDVSATAVITATFDEPHAFPEGISLVLVNGATGWAADGSPSERAGVSVRRN